jgi:hypothetical protein
LLSEATYVAIADELPATTGAVPIAPLPVKGHTEPVQVYRLA